MSSEWRNLAPRVQVRTDRYGVERFRIRHGGKIIPVRSLSDSDATRGFYMDLQDGANKHEAVLDRFFPGMMIQFRSMPCETRRDLLPSLFRIAKAKLAQLQQS
jgi:hypothetical protein